MLNVSLCTLYVLLLLPLQIHVLLYFIRPHLCISLCLSFVQSSRASVLVCDLQSVRTDRGAVSSVYHHHRLQERRWRHCTRNRNTTFTTKLRISEKIHVMHKLPMPSSRRELLIRLSFHLSYLFYLSLNGKMRFISDFVSFQFSLKVAPVNEGEIHIERMDK